MGNTWMKLYHELLDDPKVGMMNDHLFRRMIELFLLAGRENKDGLLSTPTEIAWTLRTTEKDITAVVTELKRLNVINETEDGRINVTHFAERQSKDTTDYERVKRWRDKQKRINDNGNDTYHDNADDNGNDNGMKRINDNASDTQKITLDIDIDKDIDKDKEEDKDKREVANATSRTKKRTKGKGRDRGELIGVGRFDNVMLSEDELNKLDNELGAEKTARLIEDLSLYIGDPKNASKYTDHYLTILRWSKREQYNKPQQESFEDIAKGYEEGDSVWDNPWASKSDEGEVIDL